MVSERQSTILLLLSFFFLLFHFTSSQETGIVTYWGQNEREGELDEACATGNYEIINIGFLDTFGNGRTPKLNLARHCSESWGVPCTKYASQIAYCQKKGVKIFLSIGGNSRTYSLSSAEDAKQVADYLWTNFLGGSGRNGHNSEEEAGPLGDVALDGIDFDIESGGTCYYDVLANQLDSFRKEKDFRLSAAPQCRIPDPYLGTAIDTGKFDHVWVLFYNDPWCQYSPWNTRNFMHSWNQWSDVPVDKLYLGLPASPAAAGGRGGGYIPADELLHKVLPRIEKTPHYGGVMLWSRYYDKISGYSEEIISAGNGSNLRGLINKVAKI